MPALILARGVKGCVEYETSWLLFEKRLPARCACSTPTYLFAYDPNPDSRSISCGDR